MGSISDPKIDDSRRHHHADTLQQVANHVDEGSADACVAMATKERVGVAMADGALTVLVDLVVAAAVGVEAGGVVEDVGHAAEQQRSVQVNLATGLCSKFFCTLLLFHVKCVENGKFDRKVTWHLYQDWGPLMALYSEKSWIGH